MGVYGEIFVFYRIKLKIYSWLYKKRQHTSWQFHLEISSHKKVINKKPLSNLYEMNSYSIINNYIVKYMHMYTQLGLTSR